MTTNEELLQTAGEWKGRTLDISTLRGLDLGCFCPLGQPCHADVLLEFANA